MKGLNKTKKKKKKLFKPPNLVAQSFSSNFNKSQKVFWYFTETKTLLFPVPHWAVDITDLPSNDQISDIERVNITLTARFSKNI